MVRDTGFEYAPTERNPHPFLQDKAGQIFRQNCPFLHFRIFTPEGSRSLYLSGFSGDFATKKGGVTDGTRTRNSQNHNLELYH